MLRSMNRDLLLGLVIPGEDRFEIRGWVRWLIGGSQPPQDPTDLQRFQRVQDLDDERLETLRAAALAEVSKVRGIEQTGTYQRGIQAHDHLMQHLLGAAQEDSVCHAVLAGDTQQLLAMLELDARDVENEGFHDGFRWANQTLADVVGEVLNDL